MGWSFLRAQAHRFGFTEAEAKAVMLITAAAITGAVLGGTGNTDGSRSYQEAYAISDSLFAAKALGGISHAQHPSESPTGAGEAVNGNAASEKRPAVNPAGLLNINTATTSDFESLPGIGPAIARQIVEYRSENGRFQALHDLIKVKYIGEKKFQVIEPYICIDE